MGLFDFLKPKPSKFDEMAGQMYAKIFPKGEIDKNAITDALLHILNNKISREEAKDIAIKSIIISRISESFDKERLKVHLSGYCLHHFTEKQVETFHLYLSFLVIADVMYRKTPSEVVRKGESWFC